MSETEDDPWGSEVLPTAQIRKRTPEQMAASNKEDASKLFKPHKTFSFNDIKTLPMYPSSIFKDGYCSGSTIGFVGQPGSGKTRAALQEVIWSSQSGYDCLYMYNETEESKFMEYVSSVAKKLGITDDRDLRNVKFWDATAFQLSTADYASMKSVCERILLQNVRYWLQNEVKNQPRFVVFDSFSNTCRRYVPQMPIFHQYLTHGLTNLYKELDVDPVTILVHQKSLGPREANTDAIVGGYGINHELDMIVNFKLHDVDVWGQRNFGWAQGSMQHTIQVPKNRFSIEEFQESMTYIKDGKIVIGPTVASLHDSVESTKMASRAEARLVGETGWGDNE